LENLLEREEELEQQQAPPQTKPNQQQQQEDVQLKKAIEILQSKSATAK